MGNLLGPAVHGCERNAATTIRLSKRLSCNGRHPKAGQGSNDEDRAPHGLGSCVPYQCTAGAWVRVPSAFAEPLGHEALSRNHRFSPSLSTTTTRGAWTMRNSVFAAGA